MHCSPAPPCNGMVARSRSWRIRALGSVTAAEPLLRLCFRRHRQLQLQCVLWIWSFSTFSMLQSGPAVFNHYAMLEQRPTFQLLRKHGMTR
jgi:hypothetical protein